jgi:hypothetical protein
MPSRAVSGSDVQASDLQAQASLGLLLFLLAQRGWLMTPSAPGRIAAT